MLVCAHQHVRVSATQLHVFDFHSQLYEDGLLARQAARSASSIEKVAARRAAIIPQLDPKTLRPTSCGSDKVREKIKLRLLP